MKTPLRLGTDTGSLDNYLHAGSTQPVPVVGMGATILYWTDRRACTIIDVTPKAREVTVRPDIATRIDDGPHLSEHQEYTYSPASLGSGTRTFRLRKDGTYVEVGDPLRGGTRLVIGVRDEYEDPSF